ncbi:hypothetical protein DXG03_008008 [Asterophora parasitica]|uniref:Uncharacterized protein n=1 Tax=Asterophora parasitica TaxID=117018 RepID=A0A9P7G0A1_9AGAR|nr:hypothetical protein DXG03_008008 [Asterophora parasitica]
MAGVPPNYGYQQGVNRYKEEQLPGDVIDGQVDRFSRWIRTSIIESINEAADICSLADAVERQIESTGNYILSKVLQEQLRSRIIPLQDHIASIRQKDDCWNGSIAGLANECRKAESVFKHRYYATVLKIEDADEWPNPLEDWLIEAEFALTTLVIHSREQSWELAEAMSPTISKESITATSVLAPTDPTRKTTFLGVSPGQTAEATFSAGSTVSRSIYLSPMEKMSPIGPVDSSPVSPVKTIPSSDVRSRTTEFPSQCARSVSPTMSEPIRSAKEDTTGMPALADRRRAESVPDLHLHSDKNWKELESNGIGIQGSEIKEKPVECCQPSNEEITSAKIMESTSSHSISPCEPIPAISQGSMDFCNEISTEVHLDTVATPFITLRAECVIIAKETETVNKAISPSTEKKRQSLPSPPLLPSLPSHLLNEPIRPAHKGESEMSTAPSSVRSHGKREEMGHKVEEEIVISRDLESRNRNESMESKDDQGEMGHRASVTYQTKEIPKKEPPDGRSFPIESHHADNGSLPLLADTDHERDADRRLDVPVAYLLMESPEKEPPDEGTIVIKEDNLLHLIRDSDSVDFRWIKGTEDPEDEKPPDKNEYLPQSHYSPPSGPNDSYPFGGDKEKMPPERTHDRALIVQSSDSQEITVPPDKIPNPTLTA